MYTGLRPLSVPIVLHHLPTGGIGSRAVTILSLLKGRSLSEACQGLDTALIRAGGTRHLPGEEAKWPDRTDQAEARTRGVTVHVVIDFIHVLQYLWDAAWCLTKTVTRTQNPGSLAMPGDFAPHLHCRHLPVGHRRPSPY